MFVIYSQIVDVAVVTAEESLFTGFNTSAPYLHCGVFIFNIIQLDYKSGADLNKEMT